VPPLSDMFPLVRQVQLPADIARRGVARLSGSEARCLSDTRPAWGVDQRLEDTVAYLDQRDGRAAPRSEIREYVPVGRWGGRSTIGRAGRS